MLVAQIILELVILLSSVSFFIFFLNNERQKKIIREEESKKVLEEILRQINDSKNFQIEKNELLATDVKNRQENSSQKINSSIEHILHENVNSHKNFSNILNEIKIEFKVYSEKVEEILKNYSEDVLKIKKDSEQLKKYIQIELQKILNEIKNPLDLD